MNNDYVDIEGCTSCATDVFLGIDRLLEQTTHFLPMELDKLNAIESQINV